MSPRPPKMRRKKTPKTSRRNEDPAHVLLGELEKAGADLKTFTAKVFYEEEDALVGDIVRRTGEVIYRNPDKPDVKSFAILFNERIAGGRKRTQLKHYVFSGRWFVEVDHDQKMFFKYEVVAPGETFDPLKLGEGPFPLPIGQERDEVLERFDVTMIELPTDGPLRKLRDRDPVDGLRLTPKPGIPAAEDYKYFELFWDGRRTCRWACISSRPTATARRRALMMSSQSRTG